jgi:unsaturated rhamnogalacturonyl hydrolase
MQMNSKKNISLFLIICGFFSLHANDISKKSILETAHKVADWQLDHRKDTTMLDWIQGPFINGLMAIGHLPGGKKYIRAVHEIGSQENWGVTYTQWRANDLCSPQSWIEMYEIKKKPEMIAPIRKELDQIMDIVSKQDDGLEFTEKNNMKWSWCDALYMAPPTFARMGKVTGEQKYYDFLHQWWWKVSAYYYEPSEHLYFRDQNYFTRREPNGALVFWSRGNGWVIGGLVRVLQYLPANDPFRPKYEQQLREMCVKLKDIQGQDGLWHSGLLDSVAHKQDETSGSAFFVYGMAYALNEGIVDKEAFNPAVVKAWTALCSYVKPDGCFTGIQPIGDSPVVFDENYSMPYGVGAFLQAASEMYKLQEK